MNVWRNKTMCAESAIESPPTSCISLLFECDKFMFFLFVLYTEGGERAWHWQHILCMSRRWWPDSVCLHNAWLTNREALLSRVQGWKHCTLCSNHLFFIRVL